MANEIRFGKGLFGWILFILIALALFMVFSKNQSAVPAISLGDFSRMLKDDRVRYVDIGKDYLIGEFKQSETFGDKPILKFRVPLPEGTTENWGLANWLLNNAGETGVGTDSSGGGSEALQNIVIPLIPWVLIFGFIWFFVFRQFRKQAGNPAPLKVFVVNQPGGTDQGTPPPVA